MKWLVLTLIVLGSIFRFVSLDKTPVELSGDELDVGYQAYSLYKTGRDIYGQMLPNYIHSLSEWRLPLLMYATIPSIAVFGLNEWGVRLTPAIFGVLSLGLMFIFVTFVTKNKIIAMWSTLILAVSPWHFLYSRTSFESTLMMTLVLGALTLVLRRKLVLGATLSVLAMYTYSTAIVLMPTLLVFTFVYFKIKPSWQSILIFGLLILPLILQTFGGNSTRRFSSLSVFNDKGAIDRMMFARSMDAGPWARIFHNKYETTFNFFFTNYIRAFSAEFLFVRGDPIFRHSIQIVGSFYPILFFVMLGGLSLVIIRKHWFWIMWLLIAPIPAALTSDGGFHATRLFLLMVPLAVAAGYLMEKAHSYFRFLVFSLLVISSIWSGHYYFNHYSRLSWQWWQFGYKQAFTAVAKQTRNYQKIFVNNSYEPALIRYAFWKKVAPADFQKYFSLDQEKKDIYPGIDGFDFRETYIFGKLQSNTRLNPNWLYVLSARDEQIPSDSITLDEIRSPMGDLVFSVVTGK